MKLNLEKKKKGAITMCTILDAAEERGVNRGETLKLIMMVQKKIFCIMQIRAMSQNLTHNPHNY